MANDSMFLPGGGGSSNSGNGGYTKPAQPSNSGRYSGNSGGGGGYSAPDFASYYNQLKSMIEEQARIKREATIRAIQAQVDQAVNNYNGQLGSLSNTYQPIKNQSEVERYKAQRSLRETQANRGALDSGVGRQENLDLSTNYSNRLNNINLQEQAEADAIRRAIADVQSQGELQKANAESESSLVSLQNNISLMKEQMQESQSSARTSAKSLASGQGINSDIGKNNESRTLSESGKNFYNSMINMPNLYGKENTEDDVAQAIQQGVRQGVLTQQDAELLANKFGFNVSYS